MLIKLATGPAPSTHWLLENAALLQAVELPRLFIFSFIFYIIFIITLVDVFDFRIGSCGVDNLCSE